mgnify:CR=1 FL=1
MQLAAEKDCNVRRQLWQRPGNGKKKDQTTWRPLEPVATDLLVLTPSDTRVLQVLL